MSCAAKCSCRTILSLGEEIPLVCGICHRPGRLTLCNKNTGGYVCDNKECQYAQRVVGDFLNIPVLSTRPMEVTINIVHDPETGASKVQTGNAAEDLMTPERFAFKMMARYDILVLPDHKNLIKMDFKHVTHKYPPDEQMTIFIEMRRPIQYVMNNDGSTDTYCSKWEARCMPGGSIRMCRKMPTFLEGCHKITLSFTDMERI